MLDTYFALVFYLAWKFFVWTFWTASGDDFDDE
jgi:hypothetical protein